VGGDVDVRGSGLGRRCRFLLRSLTSLRDMVAGPALGGWRVVGVGGVMAETEVE
jgi:hypothetical protein